MKKLPIGSQTFSELIEDQHYYVDKTPLIAELAATGKYYFLANPRRFGKSLLISTLKSAFSGEQALFNGLYLQDHWDLSGHPYQLWTRRGYVRRGVGPTVSGHVG